VRVQRLGAGESYAAWRVRTGTEDVVVRVARRPVAELPRPMANEFAMLRLVPEGLGPRPVLLDESAELFGSPFIVTTFVPGRVVGPGEWTPELLTAHARGLARLHRAERPGSVLLADHFRAGLGWWRDHHPDVVDQVAHLVPLVTARVEEVPPAPRHTLVHGDAVATNILVDEAGTPRYIDWEWADFGDPAQDLAYLGGAIATPPWYVPLSPAEIDHLLAAYREIHPDETLGPRRAGWELCERFLTALHFRTQPRHRQAAGHLTAALEHQLNG